MDTPNWADQIEAPSLLNIFYNLSKQANCFPCHPSDSDTSVALKQNLITEDNTQKSQPYPLEGGWHGGPITPLITLWPE